MKGVNSCKVVWRFGTWLPIVAPPNRWARLRDAPYVGPGYVRASLRNGCQSPHPAHAEAATIPSQSSHTAARYRPNRYPLLCQSVPLCHRVWLAHEPALQLEPPSTFCHSYGIWMRSWTRVGHQERQTAIAFNAVAAEA